MATIFFFHKNYEDIVIRLLFSRHKDAGDGFHRGRQRAINALREGRLALEVSADRTLQRASLQRAINRLELSLVSTASRCGTLVSLTYQSVS